MPSIFQTNFFIFIFKFPVVLNYILTKFTATNQVLDFIIFGVIKNKKYVSFSLIFEIISRLSIITSNYYEISNIGRKNL